jgi:DNA-binding GntR family transcriptional regulator
MASPKARQRGDASSGTLADQAYQKIRSRILEGLYPLGSALSRRVLASELGMSFLPISEALQRLEHDGLVESRPRAGTRVRVPAVEEVLERYQLREALETQSARLFTVNATKAQRAAILNLARRVDKLYLRLLDAPAKGPENLKFQTEHMGFHARIAELSRCHLLRVALEREQVLIFNAVLDVASNQRDLPQDFHLNLAEALVSGDVQKADAAMRAHINYGQSAVIKAVPKPDPRRWRMTVRQGNSKG